MLQILGNFVQKWMHIYRWKKCSSMNSFLYENFYRPLFQKMSFIKHFIYTTLGEGQNAAKSGSRLRTSAIVRLSSRLRQQGRSRARGTLGEGSWKKRRTRAMRNRTFLQIVWRILLWNQVLGLVFVLEVASSPECLDGMRHAHERSTCCCFQSFPWKDTCRGSVLLAPALVLINIIVLECDQVC